MCRKTPAISAWLQHLQVQPLAGDGGAAEGGGHGEGGKGSAEQLDADLVAEPCEVEPGPSLIAQAMRDAGLDPDWAGKGWMMCETLDSGNDE